MVNSLTGSGNRTQIVARRLLYVSSASHPLVTLIRRTRESAPTTAWRYLATGGSPATTAKVVSTPSSSGGLAFTGADIEEMAVIGVVAIGVGAVLVRGRRRTA